MKTNHPMFYVLCAVAGLTLWQETASAQALILDSRRRFEAAGFADAASEARILVGGIAGSSLGALVFALLRDIGPVAVKFGQILAMRSDLLDPCMILRLHADVGDDALGLPGFRHERIMEKAP